MWDDHPLPFGKCIKTKWYNDYLSCPNKGKELTMPQLGPIRCVTHRASIRAQKIQMYIVPQ